MTIYFSLKAIKKSFKNKDVLNGINLEAKSSEIIGLVGRSGCGKSTLLKILVGYHKADSGTILVNKTDVSKDQIRLRKLVGYTTQENSFYEKLTVKENMDYYATLYGIPREIRNKRITELLSQTKLLENRTDLGEKLSGGMKRRLDFAISLIHDPSILILDEPTAGLDPLLVNLFWKTVKQVVLGQDKIVVVSSHILSELAKHCTKIALIHKGKILKIFYKNEFRQLESEFRQLEKNKAENDNKVIK